MKRRVLAILLAALLAVVGGFLLLLWVSKADERALADQQPVDVWMAKSTVPAGTSLQEAEDNGLVEQTQVPAKSAPQGAIDSDDNSFDDKLAIGDITSGEILVASRFGDTPEGERAIEVPKGQVAVSVALTFPARVGSFITPGSHLVVYRQGKLVRPGKSEQAKFVNGNEFYGTSVLLDDVLVIGVADTPLAAPDAAPKSEKEKQAAAAEQETFVVTVALPPGEALPLVHYAYHPETLYGALRSAEVDIDLEGAVTDLDPPKAQ